MIKFLFSVISGSHKYIDPNISLVYSKCSAYVLITEQQWSDVMATRSTTKHFLNVAYKDRDLAKRLGAKWDPSVRRWYCPDGSPLSKIFSWRKAANTVNAEVAETSDVSSLIASVAMNENFDMFQIAG